MLYVGLFKSTAHRSNLPHPPEPDLEPPYSMALMVRLRSRLQKPDANGLGLRSLPVKAVKPDPFEVH